MRIVITGPFFFPQLEGVEKAMLFHARHLARRGHEVHVVSSRLQFPKGSFPDAPAFEEMDGFAIHRVEARLAHPGWRFEYVANGGVVMPGLSRLLDRLDPDVLHAHQIAAPAWAHAAAWHAWRRGKRFFYTPHWHPDAQLDRWFRNALLWGLNRLPLKVARRVYMLTPRDTEGFRREYPRMDPARLSVMGPGVEEPIAEKRPPRGPDELHILFVGRVDDHRKGFDLLRAAFAARRRPGWVLTTVGRVSDATRAALGAEFGPAVRVLGPVPEAELEREYALCDIFCMPSRYEGYGLTYIEAMRYGCAVVGAGEGGVPEVIPPGTGIVAPTGDAAALGDILARLADDPEERRRLGEGGRARAAPFRWGAVAERLEREYSGG